MATWTNISMAINMESRNIQDVELGCVYLLSSKKAMAPHSSTLAWKIPWTEVPGEMQSMGSQESDMTANAHTCTP